MRIGIDCRPLTRRLMGIPRYLTNLLLALERRGILDTEFVLFFDTARFPAWIEVTPLFRPVYVPFPLVRQEAGGNWMAPFWLNLALPMALYRQRIDVCFFPNVLAPLWGPCPYVVKLWDMSPYALHGDEQNPLWKRYIRALLPWSVRRAKEVIVPSQSTRDAVLAYLHIPEAKVRVIYEGVDPIFRPIPTAQAQERVFHRFGLTSPFILYVGEITGRKNLSVLLQAFCQIAEESAFSSLRLVLCGGPGYGARKVTTAIAELGLERHVVMTGRVSDGDLLALYNLAEVFALPSLWEGFGLPVLEAMACGAPVIASNTSSLPEIVGEAGILVDPLRVEDWAQALRRVLKDASLRSELRRKGLERVKHFSWERTAANTLDVLRMAQGERNRWVQH